MEFVVHPVEYLDEKGRDLGKSPAYRYQPFPKMLYGPKGQTRIVQNQEELVKAGKNWSPTPPKRPSWDVRKEETGFVLSEHHLAFFRHHDFDFKDLAEAKAYFDSLAESAQIDFLQAAEDWIPPVKAQEPDPEPEPQQEPSPDALPRVKRAYHRKPKAADIAS